MPDNIITRSGASALIPEEASAQIIQHATENSTFLRNARQLRRMTRKETRMPIMSLLPQAYFVNGEAGGEGSDALKKTTKAMWNNKFLNAEEIAVVIPIPEAVLEDADFDIWGEVSPHVGEAFGQKLDRAVIWGEDAPATWPTNIFEAIVAAGNAVETGANMDLYSDILGTDGLVAKMEEAGYMPSGYLAKMGMRSQLRDLRDSDDRLLFKQDLVQSATQYALDGTSIEFPRNGSILPDDHANLLALDWDQFVYGIRSDMRVKISDESVISDSDGKVVLNLYQEDAVAARFTWRLGWQVANPTNRLKPDTEDQAKAGTYVGNPERYPAGALAKQGYAT